MGEVNDIFTKEPIILLRITVINVRNIHTMHMISRIVDTSQEIKTMLKNEKKAHQVEKKW